MIIYRASATPGFLYEAETVEKGVLMLPVALAAVVLVSRVVELALPMEMMIRLVLVVSKMHPL